MLGNICNILILNDSFLKYEIIDLSTNLKLQISGKHAFDFNSIDPSDMVLSDAEKRADLELPL